MERATPIFKELGLSQDAAQKLFDFYNATTKSNAEATTKLVNDMRAEWRTELTKLPDIGDKLGTLENPGPVMAEIGKAKAVIFENDAAGLKKFNDAMNLTGAGDHPDIFIGWYKMAQRINEGSHVAGGKPSELGQRAPDAPSRPTAAQAMYPNLPSANRPSATH